VLDDLRPATRLALVRGRELYLAGHYFEAHEIWEEAWLEESGDVRVLLQALIQMAAGFVKGLRDARPAGSVKLFDAALEKLAPLPDGFAGVRLERLRLDLVAAAEAARRWRDGAASRLEARPPRLDLDERAQ
jgi:uncharacterized protein